MSAREMTKNIVTAYGGSRHTPPENNPFLKKERLVIEMKKLDYFEEIDRQPNHNKSTYLALTQSINH